MRHCDADHFAAVFKMKTYLTGSAAIALNRLLQRSTMRLIWATKGRKAVRSDPARKNYLAFAVTRSSLIYPKQSRRITGHLAEAILAQRRKVIVIIVNVVIFRDLLVLSGAKRTPVLRHIGAILPVRSNYNPILNHRIPSEFSHK